MKQYFYNYEGREYGRVSRTMARKAYEAGEAVCFCADRMRPDGMWGGGVYITKKEDHTFEQYENEFMFYNCRPETGLRIAFYAEVKS